MGEDDKQCVGDGDINRDWKAKNKNHRQISSSNIGRNQKGYDDNQWVDGVSQHKLVEF